MSESRNHNDSHHPLNHPRLSSDSLGPSRDSLDSLVPDFPIRNHTMLRLCETRDEYIRSNRRIAGAYLALVTLQILTNMIVTGSPF